MPAPTDLVAAQDDYHRHIWQICLWPARWGSCNSRLRWHSVVLTSDCRSDVPATTGVYSLVLQPQIAGHPGSSYLMYVGKARNLRVRFGDYLTTERVRRQKIVRVLELYSGHLTFFYSTIDENVLDDMEEELINAFIPPCNSRFNADVQRARGAF